MEASAVDEDGRRKDRVVHERQLGRRKATLRYKRAKTRLTAKTIHGYFPLFRNPSTSTYSTLDKYALAGYSSQLTFGVSAKRKSLCL